MSEISSPTAEEIIEAASDFENVDEALFLKGLDSSNPLTVWWAIRACGLRRIENAIPKLLDLLGKPCLPLGKTDIRRIAALSLSQFGFDKFSNQLGEVRKNTNELLREGIADALGLTKDPRAASILSELLNDEDRNVVLWASLALSKLGNVALPHIEKHLDQTNDRTRALYLLDALKKIGTKESNGVLVRYFDTTAFDDFHDYQDEFVQPPAKHTHGN